MPARGGARDPRYRPRDPRYRQCVGIVLFSRDGQVWVGERLDTPGAWQLPQGGIDPGEQPWDAALRELQEEIGTNNVARLAEHPAWLIYDLPPEIAAARWDGRFRGQRQKWFACRFLGPDSDIQIATEHPEFAAWKWLPLSDLTATAVPFKREIYGSLQREFAGLAGAGAGG